MLWLSQIFDFFWFSAMLLQLLPRAGDMVKHVSFLLAQQYVCSSAKTHPVTVFMVILEIKITVFTCLLSSGGCDSLPKHPDLILKPNKTNEGVKKQWNTRKLDKSRHIVTCLAG